MEWFVSIILKVLMDQCIDLVMKIFKDQMLKRGIKIKAEKAVGHIKEGDKHLSNNNLKGWLDELNKENS